MDISFIIPHKGREELLERTLQSICDLDIDGKKLEVIVVTQNTTLECVQMYQERLNFKVLFRPPGKETISALRNAGVAVAAGEYLVFLDADIQLSSNWLTTMLLEIQAKPDRVLVSAMQQCHSDAGIIERIRVRLNSVAADSSVQFLDGRNLFLRRQTFQQVGGFPEHLVTCEDYYFTHHVHRLGEIYVSARASYIHLGEDKNYAELFRKEIWRGQSNLQSLQGRDIPLRELPSVLTPVWQACFLLATIIALLTGHVLAGLVCLLLYHVPVVLYSVRLSMLAGKSLRMTSILWFYSVYLLARVIGTMRGVGRVVKSWCIRSQ